MHMAYFPASQRPKWSLRAGFAPFPGAANVNVIAALQPWRLPAQDHHPHEAFGHPRLTVRNPAMIIELKACP